MRLHRGANRAVPYTEPSRSELGRAVPITGLSCTKLAGKPEVLQAMTAGEAPMMDRVIQA